MINSTLNENSTNESPIQSPKKSQIQPQNINILPNINLSLNKRVEEKKIFLKNQREFWKNKSIENLKKEENTFFRIKDFENLNGKQSDNKSNLLDFDFLVGEILDKINLKNIDLSVKNKKNKKLKSKKGKIVKKKKYYSTTHHKSK